MPKSLDQPLRLRSLVSPVSVNHHVDIGFDLPEHRLNDMPLPPHLLAADNGACFTCLFRRSVGRAVVEDVDLRPRKFTTEASHDLRNRHFLVVTRDQDRDFDWARCLHKSPMVLLEPEDLKAEHRIIAVY